MSDSEDSNHRSREQSFPSLIFPLSRAHKLNMSATKRIYSIKHSPHSVRGASGGLNQPKNTQNEYVI